MQKAMSKKATAAAKKDAAKVPRPPPTPCSCVMLYTEQPPCLLLPFPCTNVRRSKAAAEQKVKEDEAAAAKRAAAKKAKWQERRSQKRSQKASGAPKKPKWIAGDWGSVIAVDRKLEEYATADAIEVAKKAAAFKKAEKEKAAAAEKTSADAAAENASVEAATKAAAEAVKNLKVASENELVVAATKQVAERIAAATKQAAERARPSLTMFKKILPWTTADGPSLCHSALAWKMMKDAPSTGCKTEFALGWEGQIFVKQAGWRTVVLRVTSEDSVGSLKTRLNRSNSRLIRSTRELWDDTRSLGSYGVRKEDTLLLCGRLLGGMPTGHPETAARAPAQTATPLDADAQGPPEPGPSEHLDAARRALVRAEGLAAELAGDLARIFPPPAAASPASDATRGSDSGASAWAYDAAPASALGTDASRATAPDVPADAGEHGGFGGPSGAAPGFGFAAPGSGFAFGATPSPANTGFTFGATAAQATQPAGSFGASTGGFGASSGGMFGAGGFGAASTGAALSLGFSAPAASAPAFGAGNPLGAGSTGAPTGKSSAKNKSRSRTSKAAAASTGGFGASTGGFAASAGGAGDFGARTGEDFGTGGFGGFAFRHWLIVGGASTGAAASFGFGALATNSAHVAIKDKNPQLALALLQKMPEAALRACDSKGESLLHAAVRVSLTEVALAVAERAGAELAGLKNDAGESPLQMALKPGLQAIVECPAGHAMEMLSSGSFWTCNVCKTSQYENPRLCCRRCDYDMCKTCNSSGCCGVEEVALKMLEKAGKKALEMRDGKGESLLHAAVRGGLTEVSLSLLSLAGDDFAGMQNELGETAMHVAINSMKHTPGAGFGAFGATSGATGTGFSAFGAASGATTGAGFGAFGATSGATGAAFGAFGATSGATGAGFGAFGATSGATTGAGFGAFGATSGATGAAFGAFGASGGAFGASGGAFGAGTTSGFGGSGATSAVPAFGAAPAATTAAPAFGATATAGSAPAFGASAASAAVPTLGAAPTFGASGASTTQGSTGSTPSFGFGSTTSAAPAFGAPSGSTASAAPAFGGTGGFEGGAAFSGGVSSKSFASPAPAGNTLLAASANQRGPASEDDDDVIDDDDPLNFDSSSFFETLPVSTPSRSAATGHR